MSNRYVHMNAEQLIKLNNIIAALELQKYEVLALEYDGILSDYKYLNDHVVLEYDSCVIEDSESFLYGEPLHVYDRYMFTWNGTRWSVRHDIYDSDGILLYQDNMSDFNKMMEE